MITLSEAQQRIAAAVQPLPPEFVPLSACWGRIAAEDVSSALDLPVFDNSAMDGYAVQAGDLDQATANKPIALSQIGRVAAGEVLSASLAPGQCARIYTGSPIPSGADAVVMQEDTRVDGSQSPMIYFQASVKPGENIRRRGQDLIAGAILLEAGQRVTAGRICLLAATGRSGLRAGRQPTVGLLATGSELQEGGQPLLPGHVYECNRTTLAALLPRSGAIPRIFPLVPDTLSATCDALERAFATSDVVLTTGGVSVGDLDWVKPAFERLGGQLQLWRVAVKPGKPFAFGLFAGKYLFGLPGNPVSALVTYCLFVHPALSRLQGASEVSLPTIPCIVGETLANPDSRPHFMRVRVDALGKARSAGVQGSHILSSLAAADGLVEVSPNSTLHPGDSVRVIRWD